MALHAIAVTMPVKLVREAHIKNALNAVMELMIMGITLVHIPVHLLLLLEPLWTAMESIIAASLVQVPSSIGAQIQAASINVITLLCNPLTLTASLIAQIPAQMSTIISMTISPAILPAPLLLSLNFILESVSAQIPAIIPLNIFTQIDLA